MRRYPWSMMVAFGFLALIILTSLAGCDNATSGRVVNKTYEEPYTYFQTDCAVWMTINGIMSCYVYQTTPVFIPECYRLGFHNDQDDEDGSVCLPKNRWDEYEEGSHYGTEASK